MCFVVASSEFFQFTFFDQNSSANAACSEFALQNQAIQCTHADAQCSCSVTATCQYRQVHFNASCAIRYIDAQGRFRREKAGTKGAAIDLYRKRKNEALEGKKLPEKLRRATVSFAEIAKDALAYSKSNKLSYSDDMWRMETLLRWFREYPAEGITAQEIERRFEQQVWTPATMNRYRALLSLTYRLAIRNGKAKENPARLVRHRLENNARIPFPIARGRNAITDGHRIRLP